MDEVDLTAEQADALVRSRPYLALLAVAAVVGVLVSLAVWCFLELVYQLQQELYVHLPSAVGYDHGPPLWWPLPILAVSGVLVALAIERLPGTGGHIPVHGLQAGGPSGPVELPGILLAALATIGLGIVLGPEAPLIALGAGLAVFLVSQARREVPPQAVLVVGAAGSFAAISFIFGSPVIAAIILIEATGIGGHKLRIILLPGLLGAGIGSLISIGMGSATGLSTSAYSLGALPLPYFARPTLAEFGWAIALAIVVAVGAYLIMHGGRVTENFVTPRRALVLLPAIGLIIAGCAIAFQLTTPKSFEEVLFSGQDALPGLIAGAPTWTLGALALLIAFKGIAYGLALGSFRGGPAFPALFLGAAAGLMAAHLPGFSLTPGVAVGMAAAFVAIMGLPLSSVVLATLLTSKAGPGSGPLIIVAVVVAYLVTRVLSAGVLSRAPAGDI